jgi:hypothetical protein
MSMTGKVVLSAWCCWLVAGCGSTGEHELTIPLVARGVGAAPFDVDGWSVTLSQARVGIGPIYFCASQSSAADLCPSAVAEFTSSATVDALDESEQTLGTLRGLSLEARTAAWDYAITWPTKAPQPVILDAAPDGHSAHFEGRASKSDRELVFSADVDIVPLLRGTHAVQGAGTPGAISERSRCELDMDASAWFGQLDYDELAAIEGDPIIIAPKTRAYEALINAMTSNAPPTLTWSD